MTSTRVYYYTFLCKNGVEVRLMPESEGRYKIMYGDENLGSYHSPEAAADDLVGGHTFFPSDGTDPSELAIPEDLGDWTQKLFGEFKRLRPT